MPTTARIEHSQSADGKVLTLIDASTYENPIANYTRSVELWSGINGSGILIDTLDFVGTNLTVSTDITADRYFSAKLVFVGSPTINPVFSNFTTERYEQNALNTKLKSNCGCGKIKRCDSMTLGFIYLTQAQVATQFGNGALANDFITSSLKWLNK